MTSLIFELSLCQSLLAFLIKIYSGEYYSMNKTELTEAVANSTDLSKAAAGRTVDAVIDAITSALKDGDQVAIAGFGTFLVRERGARTGRNPRTGEPMEIKASKVPSFKAGKALKDAVN